MVQADKSIEKKRYENNGHGTFKMTLLDARGSDNSVLLYLTHTATLLHWQVRANHERCSASGERHKEIRRRLRQLRHAELHWLNVADRVTFKLSVTSKCLHSHAPDYLSELCTPVAQVAERQHLRSAGRRLLVVPRIQLDTYGRRAFAVVGPTVWNALNNDLRDPEVSIASFGHLLKTHLFQQYSTHWAH